MFPKSPPRWITFLNYILQFYHSLWLLYVWRTELFNDGRSEGHAELQSSLVSLVFGRLFLFRITKEVIKTCLWN